jgi:hypothetical protein
MNSFEILTPTHRFPFAYNRFSDTLTGNHIELPLSGVFLSVLYNKVSNLF